MKTNEVIKQGLLNLLHENDDVEEQELNETANNVENSQEAIFINETANNVKNSQEAIFISLKHKMKIQ